MELLRRVEHQARRANAWQPGMVDEAGIPAHNVTFYVLGLDGSAAGVQMTGKGSFAVADSDGGPRLEPTVALHP
jgi:hypothetical protein